MNERMESYFKTQYTNTGWSIHNSVYVWSTTLTTLVLISYYSFCKKTHIIASVKLHPQEVVTNSFRLCDLWTGLCFDSANGIYIKMYVFS